MTPFCIFSKHNV